VALSPHDKIVLYTDGLNESMNVRGELYGTNRLRAQVAADGTGPELIRRLIDDIRRFSAEMPQKDDMCLVCCTRR
jgi:sigma-B regulation protein RsbU (phosphoserine phosphatase)